MKNEYLNDEETAVMQCLDGLSKAEKIEILTQSAADKTDETSRSTLCSLLLRLKGGVSPT